LSIDPRELEGDDVQQELDRALESLSSEDMQALTAPREAQRPVDEHGRIAGTIIEVRGADVLVDIGGKSEAFVPVDEFESDQPPIPGQLRSFAMHGVDPESGQVRLSLREVRLDADLESLRAGDVVEARVTGVNIGGLELIVKGLRAFMPKSQVELGRVEDFTPYIGKRLEAEVSEVDRRAKTLVLSRRRMLERQRERSREELKYALAEGQVRAGVVRRLADFGAFVDLGGMDGLLHVSDLSYARVQHPSEILKVGQKVDVKILKIDLVKDRISLGMKQLAPDPWGVALGNYRVGATVEGRVMRLMDFGAFVELEPGIEGLLPVSELSWTQRVRHPKDLLKPGDAVRVAILALDGEKRKLTLSLRALGPDPWSDVQTRYAPGTVVSARVTRLADFGAFVQLEEGVEGLIHISELSDKRVRAVADVVQPDQVIKVRVKSVDPEQRRISLSLRGIGEDGQPLPEPAAVASHEPAAARRKRRPLRGGLE
jgi:small subunit ribosomal protein S1